MLLTDFFLFCYAQVVVVAVIRVDKLLELVYSFVSDHIGYSKFLIQFSLFYFLYQGLFGGGGDEKPSPWKDLGILLPPIHSLTHPDEIQTFFLQSLLSLFSLIWVESSPSVVQVNP